MGTRIWRVTFEEYDAEGGWCPNSSAHTVVAETAVLAMVKAKKMASEDERPYAVRLEAESDD